MRRRTYRAHGRINGSLQTLISTLLLLIFTFSTAYMSSPAHIEIIAEEQLDEVVKEEEKLAGPKLSKKQLAQSRTKRVKVGGN